MSHPNRRAVIGTALAFAANVSGLYRGRWTNLADGPFPLAYRLAPLRAERGSAAYRIETVTTPNARMQLVTVRACARVRRRVGVGIFIYQPHALDGV